MSDDIFYDTTKLSHKEQEKLLRKAYSICESWWFDKLDCEESIARQRVKGVSFEEAMSHFVEGSFMRVIQRNPVTRLDEPHLQVVFRSMESRVDYFLWIVVPLDRGDEIVDGMTHLP